METMVKPLQKALYIYKGVFTFPVKLEVIQEILNTIYIKEVKPDFRKRIRYVADECITNIIHYYNSHPLSDTTASVRIIGSAEKIDALEFENYILEQDAAPLNEKIRNINEGGTAKSVFVDTLKKELDSSAVGAGLGLLSLKQKFGVTLKPSFSRTADGNYKFKLRVELPN